jgi:hypothetical protein
MEAIAESFRTFQEARNRLLDDPTTGQRRKRRYSTWENNSVPAPAPTAKRSYISIRNVQNSGRKCRSRALPRRRRTLANRNGGTPTSSPVARSWHTSVHVINAALDTNSFLVKFFDMLNYVSDRSVKDVMKFVEKVARLKIHVRRRKR